MRAQRVTEVRVLSLFYALGGLLCLASARWPLSPRSPVTLTAALGGAGSASAVLVLVLGRRWPVAVVHGGFVVLSALVGLVASGSVTAVGVVGLGPVVIAGSSYAAHVFDRWSGRAHVLTLVVAATAGAIISPSGAFVVPWVIIVVTAVAVLEVHGLLVRRLRALASTDALTGLANRRSWEEAAARDLAQAMRSHRPLTVMIIDLDGFKAVNDTRGHAAGDALLRELAGRWSRELRRGDLLGRYGGDEFVVSLPGADRAAAAALERRLRMSHPMTWSAGVATSGDGRSLGELLVRADADLYASKRDRTR